MEAVVDAAGDPNLFKYRCYVNVCDVTVDVLSKPEERGESGEWQEIQAECECCLWFVVELRGLCESV